MTPQSAFMVLAPVARDRVGDLRRRLAEMTLPSKPGQADPENALVPFGRFDRLHFARFVVLEDPTWADVGAYGETPTAPPVYLAFLGDFDAGHDPLQAFARDAGPGLRRVFSMCDGFSERTDLLSWMRAHRSPAAATYCNWVGRTVRQCREEARLQQVIADYLRARPSISERPAKEVWRELRDFVHAETTAGRLTLTPPAPTPPLWALRHALDVVTLAVVVTSAVATLPVTGVPLLVAALRLRAQEKSDPEIAPAPTPDWAAGLSTLEDHDVTNQFTALGTVKPGLLRRLTLRTVLWLIDLSARTLYTRGRLARVQTIHFARWVYLDGGRRVLFASNYDGSLESYMDDFINKVGFGLNAVFSNGVGYPETQWLLGGGARREQPFKRFLRRHQLPTDVWYSAHAGKTAADLERNASIRRGVERQRLSDEEAERWVALL